MSDETKKASVPAWQQAAAQSGQNTEKSTPVPTTTSESSQTDTANKDEVTTAPSTETQSAAATTPDAAPSTSEKSVEADQREQIRKFLKDPSVEGQTALTACRVANDNDIRRIEAAVVDEVRVCNLGSIAARSEDFRK